MKKLGVVIPVANEEATIEAFLRAILKVFTEISYESTAFIVMDTYSKDSTLSIVEKLQAEDPRIKLIFYKEARGVVSCHFEGMRQALAAGSDYVIEMDSGWSHPPEKIKEVMVALAREGYEVVSMSRFMKNGGMRNLPFYRTVVSWGGTLLSNLWLGMHFTDSTTGFIGYQAHVLRALDFKAFLATGGIYATEMKYYVCDFKWTERPLVYVGSTTDFKLKWIWIALEVLYKMKSNKTRARIDQGVTS